MVQKVILLTGASSGIGKKTALDLLKQGHIVYGAARRLDKMNEIVAAGGKSIKLDITNEDQIELCVKTIIDSEGRLDVLINNAGYGMYGSVEETLLSEARQQFDVNIFGLASITQKVIPIMRAQKSGTIINISSMGGKVYLPFGAWYHATKHALEGWSDCLRVELAQFGIKVVIIEPGVIETDFGDVMLEPMLQRSGNGVYANIAHKMAESSKKLYTKGNSSKPDVISKLILKAISTKKPKIRYVAGKFARMSIFARKWLGDSFFDMFIKKMM